MLEPTAAEGSYPKLAQFLGTSFNQNWIETQQRKGEPVDKDRLVDTKIPTWPREALLQIHRELGALLQQSGDVDLCDIVLDDFGAQLASFTTGARLREWLHVLNQKIHIHLQTSSS